MPTSTCLWMLLLRLNAKPIVRLSAPAISDVILTTKDFRSHDDVIKWKHFPCYWPFMRGIHRSAVNSPHKGQWGEALMFSLICAWINGWVNNGEAGDLRRHRAHYDVTLMVLPTLLFWPCFLQTGWPCANSLRSCGKPCENCVFTSRKATHFRQKYGLLRTINVVWNLVQS